MSPGGEGLKGTTELPRGLLMWRAQLNNSVHTHTHTHALPQSKLCTRRRALLGGQHRLGLLSSHSLWTNTVTCVEPGAPTFSSRKI